ncbi:MAG: glycosyltransferase family 39 protein [Lachnospiraceae bacterium]|nr:glycosyltransferase family 39 protein [Lachnospiraceae bacterium]MDD7628459.1 glycosyltransferase family 39 protein [Lachnospiraceae bacterium]MDY4119985.1 glycosyltransferase family 39 protein [Lachnospiraceae bacterium]
MREQKIVRVLTYFYLVPLAAMVVFNTINSCLRTTYFELYKDMETAKYKWDNPIFLLVISGLLIAALYVLWKKRWFDRVPWLPAASVVFGGAFSLMVVLLVQGTAICDGQTLSDIAVEFMQGNYSAFEQGKYMYNYSFQIGMTALLEIIYRIFGIENYLVFQILNVIGVMIFLWMLSKTTGELFEDERIRRIEAVLSMGMLPLFLFSTFVYGDVIGWAFGSAAIYCMIRFLKSDSWKSAFFAAVLLAAGIVIKSNISILLIAAVIAVILRAICNHRYRMLILILVMIILPKIFTGVVETVYVHRAGLSEYPEGIPKVAWVAMSLQETDEGGYACGWYNSYNWIIYNQCEYDRQATTKACLDNLKQSLDKLVHEQKYALNYFYKKFTSQWNDPTFLVMLSNEWCTRHSDKTTPMAHYFIFEGGRDILCSLMNIYHFFLFFCVSVYFWLSRGKWSLPRAYFALNIFGGLLFHMIWEAKTRYVLGYFVLMLPLAACGCGRLLETIEKKIAVKATKKENCNATT